VALELEGQPELMQDNRATDEVVAPDIGRRVIRLAWPVIAQNLLETAVGVVDTLLVARLGAVAIAGVGTALQVMFFLLAILSAVTIGASIMVAHAVGADDWPGARRLAKQSLVWGLLAALPLALGGALGAHWLIGAFGVAPDVAAVGAGYLRITMIVMPALLLVFVAGAVLRGAGDTRTPMLIGLLSNIINAVLAWGLIYGHLGMPALGADGSAWAAAAGRITGAAVLIAVLVRGRDGLALRGWADWRPHFAAVRRVLTLGVPAAIEQTMTSAAFTALTLIVATLGTRELATQRITFNALSVAFLPGFGFAIAAGTLVGQSLGARRPAEARAAARAAAGWAAGWAAMMGAIFLAGAPWIMDAFTDDPEVIALGARSLRALALAQPMWGQLFVWSGALRGAGNTRFPLIVNTLGVWAVVALSLMATLWFHADLAVLWAFFIPCSAVNAFVVWLGFRRDKLRNLYGETVSAMEMVAS
jgi:multidrug resistance protein, MATE family